MRVLLAGLVFFAMSCIANQGLEEGDPSLELSTVESELSYVPGCHLYVGSNYGGQTLHMARGTTIADLHAQSMGDKISSVRLIGDSTGAAAVRLWINKTYQGTWWYIGGNVITFHDGGWGNLGDNASSADCYNIP